MFRVRSKIQLQAEKLFIEAYASSEDTKPVTIEGRGLSEGSTCIETDTGDLYMFTEETNEWNLVAGGGGASGYKITSVTVGADTIDIVIQ